MRSDYGIRPRSIVECRGIPSLLFKTGVIHIATVKVIVGIRTGRCAPAIVCSYYLRASVGIRNPKFAKEPGTITPACFLEIPYSLALDVIPSVAQYGSHGVFTLREQRSDVVRYVKKAFVEMGISRIKEVLAHTLSVYKKFCIAGSTYIGTGRSNWLFSRKGFTKQRSGFKFLILFVGYPFGLPIGWIDLCHLECGRLGSARFLTACIPNRNIPVVHSMGLERSCSGISGKRQRTFLFVRIPHIGFSLFQQSGRSGNMDLVIRLAEFFLGGAEVPGKAGRRGIQTDGS